MYKLSLLLAVFLFLIQPALLAETDDSIRIAIIDTGISTQALNSEQIAQGKNYILPEAGTEDKINHGTAIASLIIGKPDRGLEGAYPEATLVPLVYISLDGKSLVKGDADMIAQMIYDAVDLFSCRVINLSAGVLIDSKELKHACEYAEKKGVVIVSAVGNDHVSDPQNIYYPAAYDTVIGVGSLDAEGEVSKFSQQNTSVALVASGEDLWVARASGRMTHVSGTSYASAFVSAAAAMILAENPDLTPADVRSILYESADDMGEAGYDIESGYGALNWSPNSFIYNQ
ncbi:MAG: S8 family serine peptidase [Dethiosulfatibacter sp.]|nr:S8 family serine peptidase [Dethiosulfatibacter sp.]